MIWLVLGLALWSVAHLFKRVAPVQRNALTDKMGDRARGLFAGAILFSIVLMVIGYRAVEGPFWWGRHPATVGINNLLMLLAVYLFAASGLKTRITRWVRHPQLTAVKLWCVAHLLVNGDLASFVLFGGILAWAVAEVIIINRTSEPATEEPGAYPPKAELRAVIGTVVVFAVISVIHIWLGYWPFG